ncbi:MAG: hypothetical protein ACRDEA_10640, partial [Microcystaceae cyanobacterium]
VDVPQAYPKGEKKPYQSFRATLPFVAPNSNSTHTDGHPTPTQKPQINSGQGCNCSYLPLTQQQS